MKKIKANWKAHILTLFPEMFPGPLGYSIVGKALEEKVWSLKLINLQNFSKKGPKYVDDKPYGGGSGMIIKSEIIHKALKETTKKIKNNYSLVFLTPKGKKLNQEKEYRLMVAHSNCENKGKDFINALLSSGLNIKEHYLLELGGALGAHAGPNSLIAGFQEVN